MCLPHRMAEPRTSLNYIVLQLIQNVCFRAQNHKTICHSTLRRKERIEGGHAAKNLDKHMVIWISAEEILDHDSAHADEVDKAAWLIFGAAQCMDSQVADSADIISHEFPKKCLQHFQGFGRAPVLKAAHDDRL